MTENINGQLVTRGIFNCREAVNGKYKSLHAVVEMVELMDESMNYRGRFAEPVPNIGIWFSRRSWTSCER